MAVHAIRIREQCAQGSGSGVVDISVKAEDLRGRGADYGDSQRSADAGCAADDEDALGLFGWHCGWINL
jgi:hypothetical protein